MTPERNDAAAARPTSRKWYWISGMLALIVIAGIAGGGVTRSGAAVATAGVEEIPSRKWSIGTEWLNSRAKGWALVNGITEEGC